MNSNRPRKRVTLLLVVASGAVYAQTLVDLRTQTKSVDFSSAIFTKPVKSGPALPAACDIRELFFLTTAPAGANLYGCTASNTWTSMSSGGSVGGAGTQNTIALWSAAANLGNSSLSQDSGTGQVSATKGFNSPLTTVAFSATPTFDASLGNAFKLTLSGDVGSSALSNGKAGQQLTFHLCQDATGGRLFGWPANFVGAGAISSAVNACTQQSFLYDGANAIALGAAFVSGVAGGTITLAGVSGGSTTVQPAAVAGGVLTLPAVTDTLVGRDTSDTLTNKTLTAPIIGSFTVGTLPSAAVGKVAYVTDGNSATDCTSGGGATKVLCLYTGSAWAAPNGGGGGGGASGPTTHGRFAPFGYYFSAGATAALTANQVKCWNFYNSFPIKIGTARHTAQAASGGTGTFMAAAVYDKSGSLITNGASGSLDATASVSNPFTFTWSTPPTLTSDDYYAYCLASNGTPTFAANPDTFNPYSLGSLSPPEIYTCGNAASVSGGVVTFPATCGTKTGQTSSTSGQVGVFIFW